MKKQLALAAAGLLTALVVSAVIADPPAPLIPFRDRGAGAVSLAEFRQLQAEVQGLRQQVARLDGRVGALEGKKGGKGGSGGKGGIPLGGPGNRPGCPECP